MSGFFIIAAVFAVAGDERLVWIGLNVLQIYDPVEIICTRENRSLREEIHS